MQMVSLMPRSEPMRMRALIALVLMTIVPNAVRAQVGDAIPGRLVPVANGYLGMEIRDGGSALTRYDRALKPHGRVWLPGAGVRDILTDQPGSWSGPDLLLISLRTGSALYTAPLDNARYDASFSLVPFSRDTLPRLETIVGRARVARDDGGTDDVVVLTGDSAICMVNQSGHAIAETSGASLGRLVLGAFIPRSFPHIVILLSLDVDGLMLTALNAADARRLSEQRLPTTGRPVAALCQTASGESLVIASGGPRPTVWVADVRLESPPAPYPLDGPPLGITTIDRGVEGVSPVVVLSTLPGPTLQIPGDPNAIDLDYRLGSQPAQLLASKSIRVLAASDSLAIFDARFTPRGILAATGGFDGQLVEIDSLHAIVDNRSASRLIILSPAKPWTERHWKDLTIGTATALAGFLAILAWRRFRFLRTIYTNMVRVPGAQGVIVTSKRGRVRRLNDSALRSLGIDVYIPRGRHLHDYLRGERYARLAPLVRRLLINGEVFNVRLDMEGEARVRALNINGRPLISESGSTAGYLLLVDDVTGTLERERLLNWASVAHHIAHEMKTPIGTVMMTAETLHDRLSSIDREGAFIRATTRIVRQASRLREIVDDLLTIARSDNPQRMPADMNLILESVTQEVREHIPPNISLHLDNRAGDARCHIDVNQMFAAMRNLVDNAWQAIGTRPGGRIDVVLDGSADELTVSVSDNGPGMVQGTLARIFQPFYTERQGGSGIGTMIIKRVIEAHGGSIDVTSQPGAGTCFTATLPRRGHPSTENAT